MVKNLTSFTGSGIKDFFLQRITAVILLVYIVFMVAFFVSHPVGAFPVWHDLFACLWMKIFTLFALVSLIIHAWIGMWTIFTDYIHCSVVRGLLQVIVILAFLACVVWGITILWS